MPPLVKRMNNKKKIRILLKVKKIIMKNKKSYLPHKNLYY